MTRERHLKKVSDAFASTRKLMPDSGNPSGSCSDELLPMSSGPESAAQWRGPRQERLAAAEDWVGRSQRVVEGDSIHLVIWKTRLCNG